MQRALDYGLHISVTPHLDDGMNLGAWRNDLDLDPYKKYSGYSYNDVFLYPLAGLTNPGCVLSLF